MTIQPELDLRGMVRSTDPGTSRQAALAVAPHLSVLQTQVLEAFKAHGPMNDWELENLPEFSGHSPTTVRKRRTDLYHKGLIVQTGTRPNPRGRNMILWGLLL